MHTHEPTSVAVPWALQLKGISFPILRGASLWSPAARSGSGHLGRAKQNPESPINLDAGFSAVRQKVLCRVRGEDHHSHTLYEAELQRTQIGTGEDVFMTKLSAFNLINVERLPRSAGRHPIVEYKLRTRIDNAGFESCARTHRYDR